jgi:hypothetical protein
MPRKTPAESESGTVEDKLDEIVAYLHRMERRDRARMIGSYIHGTVWLGFTLFIIWSTWYFVANMPQMIEEMTNQMINRSMGIDSAEDSEEETDSAGFMKMLENYLKGQE